jgi:hypothetical protein
MARTLAPFFKDNIGRPLLNGPVLSGKPFQFQIAHRYFQGIVQENGISISRPRVQHHKLTQPNAADIWREPLSSILFLVLQFEHY